MRLILASASPRRQQILTDNNIEFECVPCDKDERKVDIAGLKPYEVALKLARFKAACVYESLAADKAVSVLGADTVVVLNGEILGKPYDKAEAVSMLKRLSGQSHHVITGVAVADSSGIKSAYEVSEVTFPPLNAQVIEWYVEEYKPYDKAGGYGIQELHQHINIGLNGSYDNVVGLSIKCVSELID